MCVRVRLVSFGVVGMQPSGGKGIGWLIRGHFRCDANVVVRGVEGEIR